MLKENECVFVEAGEIIVELFELSNKCKRLKNYPDMQGWEIMMRY